ncbi:polyprenyl synthetase family protein [Parafrankia sp. EUN1f]|uniref:polyprenyl synthetase family protein n=1 Tax=Parafrankia sp. EUN1f TaxID=102897 RepID=UPI0002E9E826|nr:polyprenyl synthetase family protein [Parafrankia sp. EUN1f]
MDKQAEPEPEPRPKPEPAAARSGGASPGIVAPYLFGPDDLAAPRLDAGVHRTLDDYYRWRDRNPDRVAEHVNACTRELERVADRHRHRHHRHLVRAPQALAPERWSTRLSARRRADERERLTHEVNYFAVYNLGEVPSPEVMARIVDGTHVRLPSARRIVADIDERHGVHGVARSLVRHLPELDRVPEVDRLTERLNRLHHALPEDVVAAGAMGKVVRTLAGVLAIGAYDTLDADQPVRVAHLTRLLTAGYAYGAAYAIVDDSFHDVPHDRLPPPDRERYHRLLTHALATGEDVDTAALPDHPLAEELCGLYDLMRTHYPFDRHRNLYRAAQAMYLAQDRDAARTADDVRAQGIRVLYPDIFIKAGMSRIVANILGRRELPDGFYTRALLLKFLSQFSDDLRDVEQDTAAGRLTPFTAPPEVTDSDPLYDLFAYRAYVAAEVFQADPGVCDALEHFGAGKFAEHFAADPARAARLLRRYDVTTEIARFLRTATGLRASAVRALETTDTRLRLRSEQILSRRDPAAVDVRTFTADRLGHINHIVHSANQPGGTGQPAGTGQPTGTGQPAGTREPIDTSQPAGTSQPAETSPHDLDAIRAYALGGHAKRLRPVLTLMLAEGLRVPTRAIEPLLAASELFHTASLLLDDLPAQDNATTRRGRPTAHRVFDEGSVQLAAVSMISSGFGQLARLHEHFPPVRVVEVVAYAGSTLGPERLCRGQNLDLHLARRADDRPVTGTDILEMYRLKSSTSIEAALVPLMMLLGRPDREISLVERYARHAGIVFQIRDDVLDLTAADDLLGKDTGHDTGKVNAVRAYGRAEAERLMHHHLTEAVGACADLRFDTRLLEAMAHHFATRRR